MRQDGGDISKIILILSFVLVPALICFLKGFTEIIKVESNRMMFDYMEQDSYTYRPWVPDRVRKSLVRVIEYGWKNSNNDVFIL